MRVYITEAGIMDLTEALVLFGGCKSRRNLAPETGSKAVGGRLTSLERFLGHPKPKLNPANLTSTNPNPRLHLAPTESGADCSRETSTPRSVYWRQPRGLFVIRIRSRRLLVRKSRCSNPLFGASHIPLACCLFCCLVLIVAVGIRV